MTEAPAPRRRAAARVGILSHGTSQFDSRAHRVARSLVAGGDTVTLYSRHRPGLPVEEMVDGYRVVRIDVNSVVMEDTEHKNNQQTLILQAEQAG